MICQRKVFSKPYPCEIEPPAQRELAEVYIDTDKEIIALVAPDGTVLYRATWELWAMQQLLMPGEMAR